MNQSGCPAESIFFLLILFLLSHPGPAVAQQGQIPLRRSLQELANPTTTDAALQVLVKQGKNDTAARTVISMSVIKFLNSSKLESDTSKAFFNEIRLAGELQVRKAAPALIRLLGLYNQIPMAMTGARADRMDDDPIALALCKIRDDDTLPLFEPYLRGTNDFVHHRALRTLLCYATKASRQLLEEDLKRETNFLTRQYLEGNGIGKNEWILTQ